MADTYYWMCLCLKTHDWDNVHSVAMLFLGCFTTIPAGGLGIAPMCFKCPATLKSTLRYVTLRYVTGDSKNVQPEELIIDRGEVEVDNHFRRVNILTITLSGM